MGRPPRFAGQYVTAEIAYVSGAVGRDDHVVDVAVGYPGEVGMNCQRLIGLASKDGAATHGDDEQPAVGSQPRPLGRSSSSSSIRGSSPGTTELTR